MQSARQFIRQCLTIDPSQRMTAHEALTHPFLAEEPQGKEADLLPVIKKNFNARRTLHAAIDTIRAINKLREGGGMMNGAASKGPPKDKDDQHASSEPNDTVMMDQDKPAPLPSKGLWSAPVQK